jgi:hypothetical protein
MTPEHPGSHVCLCTNHVSSTDRMLLIDNLGHMPIPGPGTQPAPPEPQAADIRKGKSR